MVHQNRRISITGAANGYQYLNMGLSEIHEKSLDAVLSYGLVQCVVDAGAGKGSSGEKIAAMKARWEAIRGGTYQMGERLSSSLVMGAVFAAARGVGLWRELEEGPAREKWKGLTDIMRARVAAREDVIAAMANGEPDAEDELDSMFE
jgi:hypothetical protein